jgi:DNA-directed RNA polymerase subunit RPC12/RpoP
MRRTKDPPGATAIGRLSDGTPYFAPLGEVRYDAAEDRVMCHLCGEWFRLIGGRHLIARHGWTVTRYRETFGLLKQDATSSRGLSQTLRKQTRTRIANGELVPHRIRSKPLGVGGRGVRHSRSLGALHPDLLAELHPQRNANVDPFRIGERSGTNLWWRCSTCHHEWKSAPHERAKGGGCPVCAIQRRTESNSRVRRERSLAIKRPDLLAELHRTLNPRVDPYALGAGSGQKVWWCCSKCGSEWQADPAGRARGSRCPACGRRRMANAVSKAKRQVSPERSIARNRPQLALELHPTRNRDLDPLDVAAYSNRLLWWLCPGCGNAWEASPKSRRRLAACPSCRS